MQFRQGDLLFTEVSGVPASAVANDSRVLAYGEATGHAHTLTGQCHRRDVGDEIYVSSDEACSVVHDEHGSILLSPGKTYKVQRQRQYDPLTSIPRPVID